MQYKILRLDAVLQDVKEAKAWYKRQLPGLEKRFAYAVKQAILQLATQPYSYAIRYKNIRIAHPVKFPYNIHFYREETTIVIVAILFEGRDPNLPAGRAPTS
jgi:plasmid stabilization system protein ParE